jgi:20S proteasome alpha/beta subunit
MMVPLSCFRWTHSGLLLCFMLMFNTAVNAYDSSSMQYHPDGRVLQIEYSKDAVKKGGPIGAYRCKDGIIVVAVRKSPISKFLVHHMQKVFRIDSNIIIAATGLLFDASVIVDVAKKICLQHRNIYCDEMPVENLCEDLSEIMHKQARQILIYFKTSLSFIFKRM